MLSSALCIGIDAGGTKTRMVARLQNAETLVNHEGAGANLQRVGAPEAADTLAEMIGVALGNYPGHPYHLCIGIAGGGRSEDQKSLSDALLVALANNRPASLLIVDDARIALEAAFEGESGMIMIAGTGSIAYARTPDGAVYRAGGWGYLLGDDGSGYALGRAGLKAVAVQMDGGPDTVLVERARMAFGIDNPEALIRYVYRDQAPLQHFAPHVLEAAVEGDPVATALVHAETTALATEAACLAARAPGLHARIALLGGLGINPYFRAVLFSALRALLPGWALAPPRHPPAFGALLLAQKAAAPSHA